ncbi:MAG: MBL fold metallo-hydrolase [Melioribacter sp.]|uniref:MBL fold metallo-hydrolase n=1 Tax=Melioribacter sp. TaxID=2052167 RepID=UPI003BE05EE0
MKIGSYQLIPVETCSFKLDGGAMFGVVPKIFWEKTNPPDEQNRILLHARCLLLESPERKILIDTGVGGNWSEKFSGIYCIDNSQFSMEKSLSQNGVNPEDITDVIITHLHFDHTGGATKLVDGQWQPSFPNATYYIQKKQYDWAMNPSLRDKASYFKERYKPLADRNMVVFTEGNQILIEGIEFIEINGHTFGQQLVKISDSDTKLLYCADLIPFTSHIPLPYIMGYDLQPLVTLKEKIDILNQAVEENWTLFFEHDPYSAAATLERNEKGAIVIREKFEKLP